MTVPAWRRNESKVLFLANFTSIRRKTIEILMRDFGIKRKKYTVNLISRIYKMTEDDTQNLKSLMDNYGIAAADIDKYPAWLIERWRQEVMAILNNIGIEIHLGNSINVTSDGELAERRGCFSTAIGYCNALEDKLQEIADTVGESLGSYEEVIIDIDKEINLLKGLRRSDKKKWENKKKASVG